MTTTDAKVFCNTAIGFVFSINDITDFKRYMDNIAADKKVDVQVNFDGIVKEFTIDEFMNRLGFGDKE